MKLPEPLMVIVPALAARTAPELNAALNPEMLMSRPAMICGFVFGMADVKYWYRVPVRL